MFRVLKPGGRLLVWIFPTGSEVIAKLYDLYSFKLLPKMGELVATTVKATSIWPNPSACTLTSRP